MSPQTPSASTNTSPLELDAQFEALNPHADEALAREKQRLVTKFVRAQRQRRYMDAFTADDILESVRTGATSAAGIAAAIPKPPPSAKSATHQALWGVLIGAATQFCLSVPELIAAEPEHRMAAYYKLVTKVCGTAVTSGLVVFMTKKLEEFLKANASKILGVLCSPKQAEEMAFKLIGKAGSTSAACGALVSGAFMAIMGLWHGGLSAWAKSNGDLETSKMEWDKARSALGIDNLVRLFVSSITGLIVGTVVVPVAGTGYMGVLLPCFVYFLAQWLTEYVISQKNRSRSWSVWLASFFMEYRGAMAWDGGFFDDYEDRITDELRCEIGFNTVVDPVRSVRTGKIYERAKIYKWIDEKGRDPHTRERVTRLDYVDSPLAKEYAAKIAALLGAIAVPVE